MTIKVCGAEIKWINANKITASERKRWEVGVAKAFRCIGANADSVEWTTAEFYEEEKNAYSCAYIQIRDKDHLFDIKVSYPDFSTILCIWSGADDKRAEKEGYMRIKELFAKQKQDPGEKHQIATKYNIEQARSKANNILNTIGPDDFPKWMSDGTGQYINGKWVFTYVPHYNGYALLIDRVSIELSDVENLNLCAYRRSSCHGSPNIKEMPEVIEQAVAEQRALVHIKRHRRRSQSYDPADWYVDPDDKERGSKNDGGQSAYIKVKSKLCMLYPNYIYTNRFKDNEKEPDKEARWTWVVDVRDCPRGLDSPCEDGPITVYIDAITGECIGGKE
jgi:hypothetical protein